MGIPWLLLAVLAFAAAENEKLVTLRFCDPGSYGSSCEALRMEMENDRTSLSSGRLIFTVPGLEGQTFAGNINLECARLVKEGAADVARLSAEELFGLTRSRAYAQNLVPIAAGMTRESCSSIGSECHQFAREYSVAVVSKSAGIRQLSDLRDKKPCFDSVGDASGWIIPVYNLIANWTTKPPFIVTKAQPQTAARGFQLISPRLTWPRHRRQAPFWANVSRPSPPRRGQMGPVVRPPLGRTAQSCPLDLSIPNDVFPESCAPGAWALDSGLSGAFGRRLCGACVGQGAQCTEKEQANEALSCLTAGKGDVAFVSSRKLESFFAHGANDPSGYGFVCRAGLREADESRYCHWGMVPEDAYVTRAASTPVAPAVFGELLHVLYNTVKGLPFKYQRGKDFLADTSVVAAITRLDSHYKSPQPPTFATYLQKEGGENFFAAMGRSFPNCGDKDVMRLCVMSREEQDKCALMQAAWASAGLPPSLECVVGYGVDSCVRMINASQADGAWIPSLQADEFNHKGVIRPILDEVEESSSGSYAVAVSLSGGRVGTLKDIGSGLINVCSAGTDSFAGWEAPNAALKELGVIPKGDCRLTEAWAKMFRTSCVPGATNTTVTWGRNASNPINPVEVQSLCAGCGGGVGSCLTPSQALDSAHQNYDTYYGDIGALRCLARRKSDVAFVKSTALQAILALKNDNDFRAMTPTSFVLLCPDGTTRRSVDAAAVAACNLGRVPDKWLAVRGDAGVEQLRRWQDLWVAAFDRSRAALDWAKTHFSLLPGRTDHLLDLIFSNTTGGFRRFPLNSSQEFIHNEAFEDWTSPFADCASAAASHIPSSASLAALFSFLLAAILLR